MNHRLTRLLVASAAVALTAAFASACSVSPDGPSGNAVHVVVGYQSKTINTVTAGTLLRAKGFLEQRLRAITDHGGPRYDVEWRDYDTGAPITAQMVAQKIDIGSMGDYPLLINGSRTQVSAGSRTELVSITGYNAKGALNDVVISPRSGIRDIAELAGKKVSAKQRPEVLDAFLQAQLDATQFLHDQPLTSARIVADATGLPAEVVYLYNGPGGTSFDTTLKPSLISAFKGDVPYLESIGSFAKFDIDSFVEDAPLRKAFAERGGRPYDAALADTANPTPVTGIDPVCQAPATDPAQAGEVWFAGQDTTQPAANPTCLLRAVKAAKAAGKTVRAAYVPDTELGTRWFADRDVWVRDGDRYLPFTTAAAAARYRDAHPASTQLDFDQAVGQVAS